MAHQHMLLMLKGGISNKAPALVDEVKILQQLLKDWDALASSEPIDGMFGENTDKAVRFFQGKGPLTIDGLVGQNTWTALLKVAPSAIEMISRPGFESVNGAVNLDAIPSVWKPAAEPYVPTLFKAFQDAGIVNLKDLA